MLKRVIEYWLVLGGLVYVASHLPELPFAGSNKISPFQIYQLVTLLLWIGLLAFSRVASHATAELYNRHRRLVLAIFIFVAYAALSLPLSGARDIPYSYTVALLESGAGFGGAIFLLGTLVPNRLNIFLRVIVVAGIGLSLFCLWQFIGDNLGVPVWATQILPTTTWTQIDFTRVNGLSAEPQFLTTILLLPAAIMVIRLFSRKNLGWKLPAAVLLIDTAVFLSLSRGGFLAHGLLVTAMIGVAVWQKNFRVIGMRIGLGLVALILALLLVGWSGQLPGHRGSRWVVYRYLEQASGGLLPLHTNFVAQNKPVLEIQNPDKDLGVAVPEAGKKDDVGVVDQSTDSRLETYKTAFRLWIHSPRTIVLGIGWGNVGAEANKQFGESFSPKHITNNQTIQIITELGMIGLIIAGWVALEIHYLVKNIRDPVFRAGVVGLALGLALQLQFYSALHLAQLWFCLALILLWSSGSNAKHRGQHR